MKISIISTRKSLSFSSSKQNFPSHLTFLFFYFQGAEKRIDKSGENNRCLDFYGWNKYGYKINFHKRKLSFVIESFYFLLFTKFNKVSRRKLVMHCWLKGNRGPVVLLVLELRRGELLKKIMSFSVIIEMFHVIQSQVRGKKNAFRVFRT